MATNTSATSQNHNGTGSQANFSISIPFTLSSEIEVTVGGVLKTLGTHYNIVSSQVQFTTGNIPPSGTANVVFNRNTNISTARVDFTDGSVLTETDLDTQNDQLLFALQEIEEDYVKRDGSRTVTGDLVFEGSADDNNETTLAITNPTADRTITLPDRSGTVVTTGDTGTVTSTMINDGTIVNADINNSADIAGTKLADDSVTLAKLGSGALPTDITVASANIVDGTIVNDDIANTTITGGKLANDTITSTQIDANAVTASELADDAVDTNAVQDDAITYSKIQNVSATDRVLGRDSSGAGVVEEITPANLRTMINVEDGATADQTGAEIKSAYEGESNTNAFTDAEKTKLGNLGSLNALSDVNTAGVADGKILKYQASSSSFIIADDGGASGGGSSTFTGLTDTPANFGSAANKTLKVNSSGDAVEFVDVSTDIIDDTTPQLGGNLDVQANEINTSTTNGNIKLNPNGTGVVEIKGDGSSADGTLQLNCSQNSHGVKIKSPAHSAGASYTLTLPTGISAGNPLITDANGNLGWATNFITTNGGTFTGQIKTFGGIELGSNDTIKFDSDDTDTNHISFKGPTSLSSTVTYTLPEDGPTGTFLKTDGAGNLSFASADVVADTTPQLGGNLDVNDKTIVFDTGITVDLKTGATNAVVNGVTQHVQQGSLIIDGGDKDIFFSSASNGGKITFGSSDGATHEVMRITPSVLGASQHGKVNLNYVTANAGGNTSSANRLETTSTGMTFTGVIVPAADSTHDLGTNAVRWRNLYADTLYGDGSNLTGINTSTVAFFASQSATHNVASSTYTKVINLDQDEVTQNTGSSWADSRFTVASGQEGVYFLYGASAIDDVQRNDQVNLRFYKNGSALYNYTQGRLWYSGGSTPDQILLSGTLNTAVSLAVGDYVELYVYHNEGSTEPTEAGPTYFGGFKI